MKLREIRDELKKQYKDYIIIIKYGNFYRVFNEDTYIIHYLKKYKIHDNIVGFPINIINDIKKELDKISVSYIIYDKCMINYNNIHNQYEVVLKLSKIEYEKEKIIEQFEDYYSINIVNIYNILKSKKYIGGKYNVFEIKEPKKRIIMSQDITNKIINHFVSYYYLIPLLNNLIDSNVATRKNKGTSYGIKLLKKYLNKIIIY